MGTEKYKVIGVSPSLIEIEILDIKAFQIEDQPKFSIGSYLKVSDDNNLSVIAIVQSFKIKDIVGEEDDDNLTPTFVIVTQPVGCFDASGKFMRGGQQIAIPPTRVELASEDDLKAIYAGIPEEKRFTFSTLAQNDAISISIDGDKFFGKHIGIVGSTGSGKSCTVAKILQEGIKPSTEQSAAGVLNNSHIIIFDLHGEYISAFPSANSISIDNLVLPYWLMNSEELEELFIESQEQNSHNQVSQFRQAVIENKKKYNSENSKGAEISYDSPIYFSLQEVYNYIQNLNNEVIGKLDGEQKPKLQDGTLIEKREEHYFESILNFTVQSTAAATKASNGPFHGEFDRFTRRLQTKLIDDRLSFLLKPTKPGTTDEYTTADLADIIRQFTGYIVDRKSNITIIDLSGIPFEILSIVVSLITRLIFDFCFYFKRLKNADEEVPFLLVYEEAHNYIPQSEGAKYHAVKKSIERMAKEGRKYGISLMIVSQRPSEISETIFSQCNNFVAMRLTNPTDQQYIKRLLPDSINAITDSLPVLEKREAIIIGDSIAIPSVVRIDEIEHKPNSHDINFHTEWKKNWLEMELEEVIKQLKKEA